MFKAESVVQAADWRRNGHLFKQVGGTAALSPNSDTSVTLIKKVAHLVTEEKRKGDGRFRRVSWEWSGRPLHVLIQFLGI